MNVAAEGLTTGGWVFLVLAWTVIFGLVGYCFKKVLTGDVKYED